MPDASSKKAEEILADAKIRLGGIPDQGELNRLIRYYPTYEWSHRGGLIRDFFQAKDIDEMIDCKLKRKGVVGSSTKQQRGGHATWIRSKLRRLVIRLLYLRYRLDQGMSKREANLKILKEVWPIKPQQYYDDKNLVVLDIGQNSVRHATYSKVLNAELNDHR